MWKAFGFALSCLLVVALVSASAAAEDEQPVVGEAKEALRQELIAANLAALRIHQAFRVEMQKTGEAVKVQRIEVWRDGEAAGLLMGPESPAEAGLTSAQDEVALHYTDGTVMWSRWPGSSALSSQGAVAFNERARPVFEAQARLEHLFGHPSTGSRPLYLVLNMGAYPHDSGIFVGASLALRTNGGPAILDEDWWSDSTIVLRPTQGIAVLRRKGLEVHFRTADGALLSWEATVPSAGKRVTIDSTPPTITQEAWKKRVGAACEPLHGGGVSIDGRSLMRYAQQVPLFDLVAAAPATVRDSRERRGRTARIVAQAVVAMADSDSLYVGRASEGLAAAWQTLEREVRERCAAKAWPPAALEGLLKDLTRAWDEALDAAITARRAEPSK